ncbi:VCBS repeat-containing protein [Paenibacillus sp. PR3]|uniref:VCBS repeat-containing protein n=1 Tax=Paenibacillus terricola TaxID=2763503 RepID=A0ABR8N3G5_9BACL|nr:VCBS repeat-containing protein [Paenibacillus terricola]MBD3922081.1 VCBS repeat-containing protein [Paenibacillus terricola]
MSYHYYRGLVTSQSSVVAFAQGDVTGDGVSDKVYLTGVRTPDSPFIQQIRLVVQDGSSGRVTQVRLQDDAGYNPTLFLGDFTGNKVNQILISINTGGSGGIMYHFIYSYLNNVPTIIFNYKAYNDLYQYTVTYLDNYRVEVVSKLNNMRYIIDISGRDKEYLGEIYQTNGKLKQPISGFVNPLSGLYPVDFDSNKVYELLAYQKIAGRYNADSLGYVLNTLAWNGNQFALSNQNVAIFGSTIQ